MNEQKLEAVTSTSTLKAWAAPYVIVAEIPANTAKLNAGPEHNRSGLISYGPS